MAGLSLSLGLGLGPWRASGGGGAPIAAWRVATTQVEFSNTGIYAAQSAALIKIGSRIRHRTGAAEVTKWRAAMFGVYCVSTAGETAIGNDRVCGAHLDYGGVANVFTWSGATTITVPNGSVVWSDELNLTVPGDTDFFSYQEQESPTGGAVLRGKGVASPVITGEGCYVGATTATSKLGVSGALSTTGGWTNRNERLPMWLIGYTNAGQVAVILSGDSIMTSSNDNGGDGINGAGGFAPRALASIAGHVVPWGRISCGGERAQQLAGSGGAIRRALLQYEGARVATHFLCNYGTNDLGGARTPTQIQADLRTIWTAADTAGLNVTQMLIIPRTTGAWTLADGSDQTYNSGFGVGGTRDTVNSNTIADVGTNGLDAYIDLHSDILTNVNDVRKWDANGTAAYATSDGTHPSPIKHGAMATSLATTVSAWTAA